MCQDVFNEPRTVPTNKTVKYCTIPGSDDPSNTIPENGNEENLGIDPRNSLRLQLPPKNKKKVPITTLVPPEDELKQLREALAQQQQQLAQFLADQQSQQKQKSPFQQQQILQKPKKLHFQHHAKHNKKNNKQRSEKLGTSNFNTKDLSVFGRTNQFKSAHQQQREEFLKQRALRLLNLH